MATATLSLLFVIFALQPLYAAPPSPAQHFKHIVFVIFENEDQSSALQQSFFSEFANNGALLKTFSAEIHPSQGNYIALTSGDSYNITSDSNITLDKSNIADLLEAKGLTWKTYAEFFPGGCSTSSRSGTYVRKHDPLISYKNIQTNHTRCANIVEASQFFTDIQAHALPNYALYIPDMNNDGHDTGVAYASDWFDKTFRPLISNPDFMNDTVLVATFDENSGTTGNIVYTALVGNSIVPGTVSTRAYSHYSLLKLVEDEFGLGDLGRKDTSANSINDIWR